MDPSTNADFLLFEISQESLNHIQELLLLLGGIKSVYTFGPNGLGKSYTLDFITCLLIGEYANYNFPKENLNDLERKMLRTIFGWISFKIWPIYASNPCRTIHTLPKLRNLAMDFNSEEIRIVLNQIFPDV